MNREEGMERIEILLVEDDRMCAQDLNKRLEACGCFVRDSVSSGAAAVKQAKILRPDLVFLDIDLKGDMDGIETARQLRKELEIPVVFLISNTHIITRARTADPFGYLLKPVDEQEMLLTLENVFARVNLEKQLIRAQKMGAIGNLVKDLAHDFFNIFSIIRGYTEMCVKILPGDTKAQRNLEKILSAADRGKDLIDQYFKNPIRTTVNNG